MSSSDSSNLLFVERLEATIRNKMVLKDVNLQVGSGEIHSIFGHEAESKTVLLKVLAGELPVSRGRIRFGGEVLYRHTPRKAVQLGIEIVDKSPRSFLNLSVLRNIFTERPIKRNWLVPDRKAMRIRAKEYFDALCLSMDLDSLLVELSPGRRKLVEIGRAVCSSPRLLLVDEAAVEEVKGAFGVGTVEKLYYLFSLLTSRGTTILYSSSDIDFILEYSDRISVMRNGSIHETIQSSKTDKMELVQMAYSSILSRKELARDNFELYYTKHVYESIINSLSFPMIVTDTKKNIVMCNTRAQRFLGAHWESVSRKPLNEVLRISKDTFEQIEREIKDMSNTQFECRSEVFPESSIFVFPILDEVESYMGLILVFSKHHREFDVGKEIRTNTERFNSERRILNVVHEIKNPLSIILNYLRLMGSEQSNDRIHDNVVNIEGQVERITRLVDQLRGRRRSHIGSMYSTNKLSEIIGEIAELLVPSIENNGIVLELRYEDDFDTHYNPDLISQVVMNIMLNGIEAMTHGGKLTVTTSNESVDGQDYACIAFRDTGRGIEKDDLEKIFEPFFTTKEDSNATGIGLSICREIVKDIGGFVTVSSDVGEGSTFRIFLPR